MILEKFKYIKTEIFGIFLYQIILMTKNIILKNFR